MADENPPLPSAQQAGTLALEELRASVAASLRKVNDRLDGIESELPKPAGTLKRLPGRLEKVEHDIPANLNLTKAINDIAKEHQEWGRWSRIVQQQSATNAVEIATFVDNQKMETEALNNVILWLQYEQWRHNQLSSRTKVTARTFLPILLGSLFGGGGIAIVGAASANAPIWAIVLSAVGALLGFGIAYSFTVDGTPPPNALPQLKQVTLKQPPPVAMPPVPGP